MAQTTNHSPGPQPNYHRMGQIHRELADEMTKMSNTPQSDIGRTLDRINEKLNEVNTAVQNLDGKIDTAVQKLDGKIDTAVQKLDGKIDTAIQQMNERIDGLSQQMRISEHNQVARIRNLSLQTPLENLSAFIDPITNDPIPGFPETPRQLENMTVPMLDSLSDCFGLGKEGGKPEKLQRLRSHIGLRADPV